MNFKRSGMMDEIQEQVLQNILLGLKSMFLFFSYAMFSYIFYQLGVSYPQRISLGLNISLCDFIAIYMASKDMQQHWGIEEFLGERAQSYLSLGKIF